MKKGIVRKLRMDNIERCLNCKKFSRCKEPHKEDIVECERFDEYTDRCYGIVETKVEGGEA